MKTRKDLNIDDEERLLEELMNVLSKPKYSLLTNIQKLGALTGASFFLQYKTHRTAEALQMKDDMRTIYFPKFRELLNRVREK